MANKPNVIGRRTILEWDAIELTWATSTEWLELLIFRRFAHQWTVIIFSLLLTSPKRTFSQNKITTTSYCLHLLWEKRTEYRRRKNEMNNRNSIFVSQTLISFSTAPPYRLIYTRRQGPGEESIPKRWCEWAQPTQPSEEEEEGEKRLDMNGQWRTGWQFTKETLHTWTEGWSDKCIYGIVSYSVNANDNKYKQVIWVCVCVCSCVILWWLCSSNCTSFDRRQVNVSFYLLSM